MPSTDFHQHIANLTAQLKGRAIDADLETWLNREHGINSDTYQQLKAQCERD